MTENYDSSLAVMTAQLGKHLITLKEIKDEKRTDSRPK